ncbi:MAG: hypothetical protein Tsb0018_08810 [Opitutales bacterium]
MNICIRPIVLFLLGLLPLLVQAKEVQGLSPISVPQVLIISGTSTAGKTTTIDRFLKNHPGWVVEGWDLSLIRESEKLEKNPMSDEEVSLYLDGVIASNTVQYLDGGKSVVLDISDAPGMTEPLKQRGVTCSQIINVLLYVPFTQYLERLKKRNHYAVQSGHIIEAREPLDMCSQYPKLYVVSSDASEGLELLSEKQVRGILEEAYRDSVVLYKQLDSTQEEFDMLAQEKDGVIQDILKSLGFSETLKSGYLIPRYHGYDLIINTGRVSPEEATQEINQHLLPRSLDGVVHP